MSEQFGQTTLTLEKAQEAFLLAQEATGHTKATRDNYQRALGLFLSDMNETYGYTLVCQVTETDIRGWLAYLGSAKCKRGRPYHHHSIQIYSRNVSVFFHWLVQYQGLQVNPMAQVNLASDSLKTYIHDR